MIQVSLDTSFLISFADPTRPNHAVAVEYFRHCLTQGIPMWISTVAAGEFEVRQSISDLPLQNFRILSYNLPHAIRAAACYNSLETDGAGRTEDRRPVILNDLKIIAQAAEEEISFILTEDKNTLTRVAERLRQSGNILVNVVLLSEGFTPGRFENPDQTEMPFVQQSS